MVEVNGAYNMAGINKIWLKSLHAMSNVNIFAMQSGWLAAGKTRHITQIHISFIRINVATKNMSVIQKQKKHREVRTNAQMIHIHNMPSYYIILLAWSSGLKYRWQQLESSYKAK